MILEKKTFNKWGYCPSDLKPKSNKRILARCDNCGIVRETSKNHYRNFCHKCSVRTDAEKPYLKPKVIRVCQECGKEFKIISSRFKKGGGVFCSKKCKGLSQSKTKRGENSPGWKGGPVKRKCEECGKTFYVPRSEIRKGNGKFCSHSCGGRVSRRKCAFPSHHTKPELIFEEICKNNNLPFYSVADSKLWIGKKPSLNPDFTESNGKKIAIFINGDYWHSPLLKYNIRDSQRADVQVKICKRHKWAPIVIWESDLLRKDAEAFVLTTLKKEKVI